jgi:hypothetical protein
LILSYRSRVCGYKAVAGRKVIQKILDLLRRLKAVMIALNESGAVPALRIVALRRGPGTMAATCEFRYSTKDWTLSVSNVFCLKAGSTVEIKGNRRRCRARVTVEGRGRLTQARSLP